MDNLRTRKKKGSARPIRNILHRSDHKIERELVVKKLHKRWGKRIARLEPTYDYPVFGNVKSLKRKVRTEING
jgi:hypothetical protein